MTKAARATRDESGIFSAKYLSRRSPFDELDELDDSCRQVVDEAMKAQDDALRLGTDEAIGAAKLACLDAWRGLFSLLRLSRESSSPEVATAAHVLLADEGRRLLSVHRSVCRLAREAKKAHPESHTRLRRARAR